MSDAATSSSRTEGLGYGESMPTEPDIVAWARATARAHLAPLGRRWTHVRQVARRAGELEPVVGDELSTLVAAAYLHDVGYAPALAETGFHPLDGARFLRRQGHERLALLVAHHTGARVEAQLRGIDDYLTEFPFGDSLLDRALTYCDLTNGPGGEPVTVRERVAEICERYGPDHAVSRAVTTCLGEFERDAADIEHHLKNA